MEVTTGGTHGGSREVDKIRGMAIEDGGGSDNLRVNWQEVKLARGLWQSKLSGYGNLNWQGGGSMAREPWGWPQMSWSQRWGGGFSDGPLHQ